jgi:3-phenylpropionate/trans-cinnamate dioxygenase ferredoxin subunit
MSEEFVAAARTAEVVEGKPKAVEIGDKSIALCNVGGEFYAIENVCTHDDGILVGGDIEGASIECPRHGAKFDVRTGEVLSMPAVYPVKTFETKVEDDTIYVKVNLDE